MGGLSIWHMLLLAVVAMVFLGKGRLSEFMGDAGKGLRSFKKGLTDDDEATRAATPPARLQAQQPMEPSTEHDLQPMKDDRPRV
ncbi:Sec-independent protein translocase subunit TatA [Sphingomonas nostoxanthinifaciens]|uniref:Sec-independent protein translocase subunit TatA n=1 Tax=Sphingomonas nostoxanthinifaciens TaxID=2872652 RepID=UPI001CC1FEB8|nr:Sec-independent protein translocase subunit TatA [Sphingomonas nostoxanthinifaciens]UAK24706.1 Sec-independent protein translocase subunit TatA [Sphingomonas nostoxanthinifaciens]